MKPFGSLLKPPLPIPKAIPRIQKRSFTQTLPQNDLTPFTRRLFKLPPAPPPSPNHNDLSSFLHYANLTRIPQSSTTYVGTHYEYTVQQSLRQQGLTLQRIGGRDDAGVDLVGTWHIPQTEHPVRVFVQCKALRNKPGPNIVRELEGAFRSPQPVGWRTDQKVGILVCTREATKGVRDAISRSSSPLLFLMVQQDGTLQQALWNIEVVKLGLGMLGTGNLYGGGKKVISLTWDRMELPHMDSVEEDMLRVQEEWLGLWGWRESVEESAKMRLLDVVEELFPEEKPLLAGSKGVCSVLSDADRARVLEVLESRMHPVQEEGQSS